MFWNSLGKARKVAQNTRHENGFRRNGRHYCRVRSLLLRPGCDSTYRYKTSRRQAGLCLACITEPHVRTCVWMCEVTCTHVGYRKMTMGGNARWKKEEWPPCEWISTNTLYLVEMWQRHRYHCSFQLAHHLYILLPTSLYSLSVSFLVSL